MKQIILKKSLFQLTFLLINFPALASPEGGASQATYQLKIPRVESPQFSFDIGQKRHAAEQGDSHAILELADYYQSLGGEENLEEATEEDKHSY